MKQYSLHEGEGHVLDLCKFALLYALNNNDVQLGHIKLNVTKPINLEGFYQFLILNTWTSTSHLGSHVLSRVYFGALSGNRGYW